jgi:hypothetical protein
MNWMRNFEGAGLAAVFGGVLLAASVGLGWSPSAYVVVADFLGFFC